MTALKVMKTRLISKPSKRSFLRFLGLIHIALKALKSEAISKGPKTLGFLRFEALKALNPPKGGKGAFHSSFHTPRVRVAREVAA